MFPCLLWTFLVLLCAKMALADTAYQFTMSVSPAPVPGKPFTLTWTGGETTETVYIALNYYFADTPNQDIIYIRNDILSHAPNNGSWTYTIPLDTISGRYSFSIGINPLLWSDTSGIFKITTTRTSTTSQESAPARETTSTAAQLYNSCGLPPIPDYTYTGYQPPCTTTVSGEVRTLYPNVPKSDISLFYGTSDTNIEGSTSSSLFESISKASGTITSATTDDLTTSSSSSSSSISSLNPSFATDVIAQALQCPTAITPTPTSVTQSGTVSIFSLVACSSSQSLTTTKSVATAEVQESNVGVCHSSGYTTFSVSGTSSVCCPGGWATTSFGSVETGLYCFTSIAGQNAKREEERERQLKRDDATVTLSNLAFTTAGVVSEKSVTTSSSSETPTRSSGTMTETGATASATKKSGGNEMIQLGSWGMRLIPFLIGGLWLST